MAVVSVRRYSRERRVSPRELMGKAMQERRRRRSERKDEALRLLLEAVRDRSDISSVAVVDGRKMVVAGVGHEHELHVLCAVAEPAATGTFDSTCEKLTVGTDVLSRPFVVGNQTMYLAALGVKVSRMPEAATGIARILDT